MAKIRRSIWIIFLLLSLVEVAVGQTQDLSTVMLPVQDRSSAVFQQAVANAYSQVLIKLSGNSAIMTIPAVQNSLSKASRYLINYSYQEKSNADGQSPLYLQMVFNKHGLNQLLQKSRQPTWSQRLPQLLVILAVPQGDALRLVASDENAGLAQSLLQVATQHGLTTLLPLSDLEDQAMVTKDATDGVFAPARQAFMQRYNVHAVLFGVLREVDGEQHISWQFWVNDSLSQWPSSGKTAVEAITTGFDRVLEILSSRYAVVNAPQLQRALLLTITGINNLEDYLHVVQALKHLPPVNHVTVKDFSENNLQVQLNVTGGEEGLRQALQTHTELIPDDLSDVMAPGLRYQYRSTPDGLSL